LRIGLLFIGVISMIISLHDSLSVFSTHAGR
jgi:preprotein translocase subunit Sss1